MRLVEHMNLLRMLRLRLITGNIILYMLRLLLLLLLLVQVELGDGAAFGLFVLGFFVNFSLLHLKRLMKGRMSGRLV